MRICFSLQVDQNIPCGGGGKFVLKFSEYLQSLGYEVEYFFDQNNPPDCMFFFDHKLYKGEGINKWIALEHAKSIKSKFPSIPIITRVNDGGVRDKQFIERFSELAQLSNEVIFISHWIKNYYSKNIKNKSTVIHNSVDENIFTIKKHSFDMPRLFTHHWSPSRKKGWDFYEKIDKWIKGKNITFTFTGNLPRQLDELNNTKSIKPISGHALADEIRKHNIYVTAAENEACGQHHLEGISCGLPYLYYSKGGGLKEAGKFGVEFKSFEEFKEKLIYITENHDKYYKNIKNNFNYYNKNTFKRYEEIIKRCIQ